MRHITGAFSDRRAAESAVRDLVGKHFNPRDISVIVTDERGTHSEEVVHDTGIAEGAAIGTVLGGVLGATLAATGLVVAPGLAVLAAGPLHVALVAAAGAGLGFDLGALMGLGYWKDEVHIHADVLKKGGAIVGVPAAHEHAEYARHVLWAAGAEDVRG
jgi:hypothetical protein